MIVGTMELKKTKIDYEMEQLRKELDAATTMEEVAKVLGLEEVDEEGLDPEPQ